MRTVTVTALHLAILLDYLTQDRYLSAHGRKILHGDNIIHDAYCSLLTEFGSSLDRAAQSMQGVCHA